MYSNQNREGNTKIVQEVVSNNHTLPYRISKELEDYLKNYICGIKTFHKNDMEENGEIIHRKGDQKLGTGIFIKFSKNQTEQYYLLTCNHVLNQNDIIFGSFEIKYKNQEFKKFIIKDKFVAMEKSSKSNIFHLILLL